MAFSQTLFDQAMRVSSGQVALDRASFLAKLASAVRAVSEVYTRDRDAILTAPTTSEALMARLCFFSPRDAVKIWKPLEELKAARPSLGAGTIRILDLGAGVGATSLGVCGKLAQQNPETRIEITAVDRWREGLAAFRAMVEQACNSDIGRTTLTTQVGDAAKFVSLASKQPGDGYQLVLMGMLLNEMQLEDAELLVLIQRALSLLAPEGALIILEPALKDTSRRLQRLRDGLEEKECYTVFAPCPRGTPCPLLASDRDWCHQREPGLLPGPLAQIAKRAGLRDHHLSYAYMTLTPSGTPKLSQVLAARSPTPTTSIFRVVSDPRLSKGKRELVLCGPQGKQIAMRLNRNQTPNNAHLEQTVRGDYLQIDPAPDHPNRLKIEKETKVTSPT